MSRERKKEREAYILNSIQLLEQREDVYRIILYSEAEEHIISTWDGYEIGTASLTGSFEGLSKEISKQVQTDYWKYQWTSNWGTEKPFPIMSYFPPILFYLGT